MTYRYRIFSEALVDEMMDKADELGVAYLFDAKDPDSTVLELLGDGADVQAFHETYSTLHNVTVEAVA